MRFYWGHKFEVEGYGWQLWIYFSLSILFFFFLLYNTKKILIRADMQLKMVRVLPSSFRIKLLDQFNWQEVVEKVYLEIATKYLNLLDFLFWKRSNIKNYYSFNTYCVITTHLHYKFAFCCSQPQDKTSSTRTQPLPCMINGAPWGL